jgi:hypothetical protein
LGPSSLPPATGYLQRIIHSSHILQVKQNFLHTIQLLTLSSWLEVMSPLPDQTDKEVLQKIELCSVLMWMVIWKDFITSWMYFFSALLFACFNSSMCLGSSGNKTEVSCNHHSWVWRLITRGQYKRKHSVGIATWIGVAWPRNQCLIPSMDKRFFSSP